MKRKIDSFLPRPLSHSDELEFRTEQEVKDGIARNVVRVVTVSPTERMANLKSSDYALGNRRAAAA